MYKNFIIIIFTVFFLNGCGYNTIYPNSKSNKLNIELLSLDGDRDINNAIKYYFKRYNNKEGNKVSIVIKSESSKSPETKNLAGDTISYNVSSNVEFLIYYNEIEKTYKYSESITVNELENKLDQTTLEKDIKRNFGIVFSDRLVLELTKMK
tara:strand:+ start:3626 stop:4081 length:456 start_codon:yes stop_codon:yes gene_type:complete